MWMVARILIPSQRTSCSAGRNGFSSFGSNPDLNPSTHPSPVLTLNGARPHSAPNPQTSSARSSIRGTNPVNAACSRPRLPPKSFTSTTKIARYGGN
ncbi:hypothetical protein GCM10010484_52650 [Actinokineospora globicatena]